MNGSWRPIMAPSVPAGRPVTAPSVVTGTPSAPKATGAVLKINVNTSASSAGKPTRMRSDEVIATGVPKPAMPFEQRAEAEADHDQHNAAIVGKMVENPRTEGVEPPRLDRDIVEKKRVDHDPHDRPEGEDDAGGDGIKGEAKRESPTRAIAMIRPTTSPASDACHAGRRMTPSSTRTAATGSAATINESGRLPATGVSNCLNTS